jgi:hypothetical protein
MLLDQDCRLWCVCSVFSPMCAIARFFSFFRACRALDAHGFPVLVVVISIHRRRFVSSLPHSHCTVVFSLPPSRGDANEMLSNSTSLRIGSQRPVV